MRNNVSSFILGVGVGAAAGLLLDPRRGAARRALVRDKAFSAALEARRELERRGRDLRQRTRGVVWEAAHAGEAVPDEILVERVRAQIGRPVSHPRALDVRADGGRVIVSGRILADEVDDLLARIARVRGVRSIESQLEVHSEAGSSPDLQGEGDRATRRS